MKKPLSNVAKKTEKGGLHRALGIPEGQKIPLSKEQPKPGDSTKVKREKALARTYNKYRPGGKKSA